jgi:phage gp16-like protein
MSARCEEGRTMSNYRIKSLKWLGPVALVGVIGLAACGDQDPSESTRTDAASASVGSDRHLNNRAEELATRELAYRAALARQGERYVEQQKDRAEELATRELAYRAALARQGERYVEQQKDRAEELATRELAYRAALARQGERYVEQQKDRAESNSAGDKSSDEFVPGSRHMPVK